MSYDKKTLAALTLEANRPETEEDGINVMQMRRAKLRYQARQSSKGQQSQTQKSSQSQKSTPKKTT